MCVTARKDGLITCTDGNKFLERKNGKLLQFHQILITLFNFSDYKVASYFASAKQRESSMHRG